MNKRNVIIHAHIFKNAGTTFDHSLRGNFKDSFIDHREDDLVRNDPDFFEGYLNQNKHVNAFSSHSVYHKPIGLKNTDLHVIHFFRHYLFLLQ